MAKTYNTGKAEWTFGKEIDFHNGVSYHRVLGPCPDCGSSTISYGGGFACYKDSCRHNIDAIVPLNANQPTWWNTDINVKFDGKEWSAFRDGFINLQESIAGFGDTPQKAVDELLKLEGK